MGEAGNLNFGETRVEIDEQGNVFWIINYENDSVIEDLEAVAKGKVIREEGIIITIMDY